MAMARLLSVLTMQLPAPRAASVNENCVPSVAQACPSCLRIPIPARHRTDAVAHAFDRYHAWHETGKPHGLECRGRTAAAASSPAPCVAPSLESGPRRRTSADSSAAPAGHAHNADQVPWPSCAIAHCRGHVAPRRNGPRRSTSSPELLPPKRATIVKVNRVEQLSMAVDMAVGVGVAGVPHSTITVGDRRGFGGGCHPRVATRPATLPSEKNPDRPPHPDTPQPSRRVLSPRAATKRQSLCADWRRGSYYSAILSVSNILRVNAQRQSIPHARPVLPEHLNLV